MWLYIMNGYTEGNFVAVNKKLSIGRNREENELILDHDRRISGHHSTIFMNEERFWIQDSGSANGTFVNNTTVSAPRELLPGDAIGIGETLLLVCEDEGRLPVLNLAISLNKN